MSTEMKTFRGLTLAEVEAKVRAELGDDAVVVRQREGLSGGVGGFFQRRLYEVDAMAGEGASVDPAPAPAPIEAPAVSSPAVREDFMSVVRSGVNGTPTFFINGVRHDGSYELPALMTALQRAARA